MESGFKNKIWYFLPMILVLIYARPVEAIMWEYDNSWCYLPLLVMMFLPMIFLLALIVLSVLILDVVFISKKKTLLKVISVSVSSLFIVVCMIIFFGQNFIIEYIQSSGADEYIYNFGNDFCYDHDGKGGY